MFIVRRRRRLEQIEKTEAKRILVPSSVRNPSVSALRSHTVVGGSCRSSETVADGGEGGKEREKRRERVTERKDDKGQRKRDEWAKGMLGGEKGGEEVVQPRRPGAHNLPIGTLHYSCLQLQAANQPGPSLPPSPVICLGQIQSQPRGGFELTINFKRVRRPFHRRRPTTGGKEGGGGGDRQATVFSRVSDRRSAKGINLS